MLPTPCLPRTAKPLGLSVLLCAGKCVSVRHLGVAGAAPAQRQHSVRSGCGSPDTPTLRWAQSLGGPPGPKGCPLGDLLRKRPSVVPPNFAFKMAARGPGADPPAGGEVNQSAPSFKGQGHRAQELQPDCPQTSCHSSARACPCHGQGNTSKSWHLQWALAVQARRVDPAGQWWGWPGPGREHSMTPSPPPAPWVSALHALRSGQ